jgi:hypothetical protein
MLSEDTIRRLQCGITLKTKENPSALYTELEMIDMFKTLVSPNISIQEMNSTNSSQRIVVRVCGYACRRTNLI